ncbi:hypothetical protein U1Q18_007391 [Sarracenia purpurea var. burkii]
MKRGGKLELYVSLGGHKSIQILVGVGFLYLFMMTLEVPFVFKTGFSSVTQDGLNGFFSDALSRTPVVHSEDESQEKEIPKVLPLQSSKSKPKRRIAEHKPLSTMTFDGVSRIEKSAKEAFEAGRKLWEEIESEKPREDNDSGGEKAAENRSESCPSSIWVSGTEFVEERGRVVELPCGLRLGSKVTIVGTPRRGRRREEETMWGLKKGEEGKDEAVSQFMMELQGLKSVDGEEPPRFLHFNPRLKGDWSGKAVIEQNTAYRMQWGTAIRCDGQESKSSEETVDGEVKCEKWIRRDNQSKSKDSNATWWLNRMIERVKESVDWRLYPYPFAEGKPFVLTLSAGFQGYHVNVDGRHVTSFPHRPGFTLEDATGLSLKGDVDIHSIFAASLPTSHSNQRPLDLFTRWQAPQLPDNRPVELFIGILSSGNHFAERMAVRRSWLQHRLIKSSVVVARFFVALHEKKEVNVEMKREAEFFGDIVTVPYMDNYNLLVLKTIAVFEYGVRAMPAKYIMKCDDDTFVRVDAVLKEVKNVAFDKSFYVGNINFYHKPFRYGKWAVTYEEWAEEKYPPYANGPGYIVSSDIARFVVSEFEKHKLKLFKMEDVSAGMWVKQFNGSRPVEYIHSLKFYQFGCSEDYYTAHYQSPGQMICLWNKLQQQGRPHCCNMR